MSFFSRVLIVNAIILHIKQCQNVPLKHGEICPFKDTVALRDKQRLTDGSYLYQHVQIPSDQVAEYNYLLMFANNEQPTKMHLRGCVCGKTKMCVKLCCGYGEFYNQATFECEKIPDNMKIPTQINVTMDNGDTNIVHLSHQFLIQVGKPCQYLEYLATIRDVWQLKESGELYIHNNGQVVDTVSYCLSPYRYEESEEFQLMAMSCPIPNELTFARLLNTYAMSISVIFLIPTVLIYSLIGDLSRNIRGKQLVCYFISLIGVYSIFSFINISAFVFDEFTCKILGAFCYFFFISAYLWLSILCFDMCIKFKGINGHFSNRKHKYRFLCYSLFGWGTALMFTMIVIWAQESDMVPENFKPGLGKETCWLDTTMWSSAIYFYLPNLIIMLANMLTFVCLSVHIYRIQTNVASMSKNRKFFQEYCLIILRLFIVMGISWSFDILSFALRNFAVAEYLFVATDLCNASQGIFIFILFVLKRNVFKEFTKCCTSTDFSPVSSKEHDTVD
ncbi:G-protein coupled receptor Mth2-like [Musca autumnalis]|uniref:G-protein coupled receptor Mth2-like n=1 Tax=Musca autumnalis TaxID=221902 RepID=UPI003CEE9064